jgi:hypothetical protein
MRAQEVLVTGGRLRDTECFVTTLTEITKQEPDLFKAR